MIIDFTIWDPNLIFKVYEFKQNHSGIKKIILNAATEFQYDLLAVTAGGRRPLNSRQSMLDLINFCIKNNIELHIITSNYNNKLLPNYKNLYIHFWPTFWFSMTLRRLVQDTTHQTNKDIGLDVLDLDVGKNSNIKYAFITMNKRPRVHRAIMMDMLAKNNLINKGLVIWRENCLNYQFKYWNEEILLLDQKDKFVNQEQLPFEYSMAFAQLVTETTEEFFWISEKTSMPLFFNKPFLVAASQYFHKTLKSLGFELYDELFDYSFDEESDIVKRYDLLAKNFNLYADKTSDELKKLYSSVFEKCQYNKRLAIKLATDKTLIPNIWNELIIHQEQNNIIDYPKDINNFILTFQDEYKF